MKLIRHYLKRFSAMFIIMSILLFQIVGFAQEVEPPIQSIAWNPEGTLLAIGTGPYEAEEHDYSVEIRNAITGEVLNRLQFHSGAVFSVDWSPDGSKLVSSGKNDGIGVVWDVLTGQQIAISQAYSMPGRFADIWSPDGSQIAKKPFEKVNERL